MVKSSITKHSRAGRDADRARVAVLHRGRPALATNRDLARTLGAAIRARRRELGLTQTQLGTPLTKGFVSEVERGRSLPSLGALVLMADRLRVPVSFLLGEVNGGLPAVYTSGDENEHAPSTVGPG